MIIFDKFIQRPAQKSPTLPALRSVEARLLQQRALEIKAMNLKAPPRIDKLLCEEADLVATARSGIQGWNCLGPTDEPTVVLVAGYSCDDHEGK